MFFFLTEKLAAPMNQGINDIGQQGHREMGQSEVGGLNSGASDNGTMKGKILYLLLLLT